MYLRLRTYDKAQDLHGGDFPPVGRWSQYNGGHDARWHVELIPAGMANK